jgi:hypothetical protein
MLYSLGHFENTYIYLIQHQDFAVLPCLYFLTYAKVFTRKLSGAPAFIFCIHTEFYKPCFNGSLVFTITSDDVRATGLGVM